MLITRLLRRGIALLLTLSMGVAPILALDDGGLARGIALVNEGDFEAAFVALDAVVRTLEERPGSEKERARAQLYLGVAYLELDQEAIARAKFRDAVRLDPQMRLDPEQFSPQVIRTFEASRLEAAPSAPAPSTLASSAAPPATAPSSAAPAPAATGQDPEERRKKRRALPILLVAGGGAAAAGVALLSGGGNGAATTSTTFASGTTSTTTATTTTTTTTTTTVPPASPPAPPPPASCTYSVTPASQNVPATAATGTCRVTVGSDCPWTTESTEDWLVITGGNGPGNATISFRVAANSETRSRDARIRLRNTDGTGDDRCEIVQAAGPALASVTSLVWIGTLDVPGGAGQVVVDGAVGAFQQRMAQRTLTAVPGAHRIEALLVTGEGRPGTWRFEMAGAFVAGTLRPIAGDVLALTANVIVFRLTGRPGERVGFAFKTAP